MNPEMTIWIKINAYFRLGVLNLLRVFWYLLRIKAGVLQKQLPIGKAIDGDFFVPAKFAKSKLADRGAILNKTEHAQLFGWYKLPLDSSPDWHRSVLTSKAFEKNDLHWTQVSDFGSGVGDIKGVWELSRFTWVINLVGNYLVSQDQSDLDMLNTWLTDWSKNNPHNAGANWKCAQEASFRVLHLAAGALLLDQRSPSRATYQFVYQHLQRIAPTLGYAKAQDNNHGTSEAAALFVGASWLLLENPDDKVLLTWYRAGREYLTERLSRLVMDDGTFSQYSVTYHRVMLDTVSFVELWRIYLALPELPKSFQHRAKKATEWLFLFTQQTNGDAPNLGANDGAHILNYLDSEYRDFRPSVELASLLFSEQSVFGQEVSSKLHKLFTLADVKSNTGNPGSARLDKGGYGILCLSDAWCCLRVPRFKFRPGQGDIFHLDLWVNGQNVLRDTGSFSYNTEQKWLDYFNGSEGHNSIQFDKQQPMPKVSRFLYGAWPEFSEFEITQEKHMQRLVSAYKNWRKVRHCRELELQPGQLKVIDSVAGFSEVATLRWHLMPSDWQLEDNTLKTNGIQIEICSSVPLSRLTLVKGYESRYYGEKQAIPVLEVDVTQDAQITTIIRWT